MRHGLVNIAINGYMSCVMFLFQLSPNLAIALNIIPNSNRVGTNDFTNVFFNKKSETIQDQQNIQL